jgi:hypothetical protein
VSHPPLIEQVLEGCGPAMTAHGSLDPINKTSEGGSLRKQIDVYCTRLTFSLDFSDLCEMAAHALSLVAAILSITWRQLCSRAVTLFFPLSSRSASAPCSVVTLRRCLRIWNKRNPHTDLPPFLTRQSHKRFTLLRVAEV